MAKTKAKKEVYRQVLLRREIPDGHTEDVFWIPVALAVKGKKVREENYPNRIWTVAELYTAKEFVDVDIYLRVWKEFSITLSKS